MDITIKKTQRQLTRKTIIVRFFVILSLLGTVSLKIFAETPADYLKKGESLINEQKYDDAIEIFKKAAESQNKDERKKALANIGYCYNIKTDYAPAIEYYKKALEIDDKYPYSLEAISIIYIGNGIDYDEGLKYALLAEKLNSKSNGMYYNMACCYALKKDGDTAMRYLKRAIYCGFSDKQNIMTDTDLLNIRDRPDFQKNIANFDLIKQENELFHRGNEAYTKGNRDEAIKAYTDALKHFIASVGEDSFHYFVHNKYFVYWHQIFFQIILLYPI